jgi:hypothetical protein
MGWFITAEGAEHSASCAAPCRVGFKRIAHLEPVQLLVLARAPKCCKGEFEVSPSHCVFVVTERGSADPPLPGGEQAADADAVAARVAQAQRR